MWSRSPGDDDDDGSDSDSFVDDDDSVDDSFVGVVHNLVDQPGRSSDGRQVRLLSEGTVVLQLLQYFVDQVFSAQL